MKTNYTFQGSWSKLTQLVASIFLFSFLFAAVNLQGQTMPTPQSVPYSQDFSTLAAAYPAGWQAWQVAASAPSSTGRTNAPTVDKAIVAGTAASTSSGAYDFSGKIGFLSVSGSDVTLCFAVNTTGKSNIKITFDAMTMRNLWDGVSASGYQNGLVLQYRIGTGATLFSNLPYAPAEYLTGSTVQTTAVTTGINPVTGLNAFLPAVCENQPVVQIRWIYRNAPGGTSGSRPSVALDNIVVDEVPVTFSSGWPKAENPTASGFTAKSNINTPGKTYFVVLANGASAPSAAQVKTGQDGSGTAVADNERGSITNTSGASEYLAAVSGLSGNTTYDVYFIAEGNSGLSLQSTPQKVSVTTTSSAAAPSIIHPTATSITSTDVVLGGEITSDGGSAITERGTVWKTNTGVTIDDNKLAEGLTTTGVFSHSRTSLPPKTQIFYKAYATNAEGSTLTDEASFYTRAIEPTSAVGSFVANIVDGSSTSIELVWTSVADADGYLILKREGATAPGTAPSDLIVYSEGNAIGTGTVAAIVNSGATTTQIVSGLSSNTQYMFRIYPFGYDGSNAGTMNYAPIGLSVTTSGTTPLSTEINTVSSIVRLYVSSNNNIVVSGAKNQNLFVSSLIGQLIMSKLITTDNEEFNLNNGFYIISVGDQRFKIQINK